MIAHHQNLVIAEVFGDAEALVEIYGPSSTLPFSSTLIKLEAVISS